MKSFHVQIDKHGRLLIPSPIRNSLNYKTGDTFLVKAENGEIHYTSLNNSIAAAQTLFNQNNDSDNLVVEEFLQKKYQEAISENS